MTAFLFVPSATGAGQERRLDVATLARMFAETEEPAPRRARGELARAIMLVLILFGMIGDAVLVTRPGAFDTALTAAPHPAAAKAATF